MVSLRVSPASDRADDQVSYSDDLQTWVDDDSIPYQRIEDEIIFELSEFPPRRFYRVILTESDS